MCWQQVSPGECIADWISEPFASLVCCKLSASFICGSRLNLKAVACLPVATTFPLQSPERTHLPSLIQVDIQSPVSPLTVSIVKTTLAIIRSTTGIKFVAFFTNARSCGTYNGLMKSLCHVCTNFHWSWFSLVVQKKAWSLAAAKATATSSTFRATQQ